MTKRQEEPARPLTVERKTTLCVPAALIEQIVREAIGIPDGGYVQTDPDYGGVAGFQDVSFTWTTEEHVARSSSQWPEEELRRAVLEPAGKVEPLKFNSLKMRKVRGEN